MEKIHIPSVSSKVKRETIRYVYRSLVGIWVDMLMRRGSVTVPRLVYNLQGAVLPKGVNVHRDNINGINVEWIRPENVEISSKEKLILYSHGGGFVIGSVKSHRAIAANLAINTGVTVLTYDYPLCPENSFETLVLECIAFYRHLIQGLGYKAENIVLAGDSAGGAISCEIAQACHDQSWDPVKALYLISPHLDYQNKQASLDGNQYVILSGDLVRSFGRIAELEKTNRTNVKDFAFEHFPPILIQIGSCDVLVDQSLELQNGLESDQGVLEVWDDMWHVWQGFSNFLQEGDQALEQGATFIKKYLQIQ